MTEEFPMVPRKTEQIELLRRESTEENPFLDEREYEPEDYKGWREEIERRYNGVGESMKRHETEWEHVHFSYSVVNFGTFAYYPKRTMGGRFIEKGDELLKADPSTLSEFKIQALDLLKRQNVLSGQIKEYKKDWDQTTARLEKYSYEREDFWENLRKNGAYSRKEAYEKAANDIKEAIDSAERDMAAKYPEVATLADQINALHEVEQKRWSQVLEVRDSVSRAGMKLEAAEQLALYGEFDVTKNPLWPAINILQHPDMLAKYPDDEKREKLELIKELLNRYYYERGPLFRDLVYGKEKYRDAFTSDKYR